MGERPHRDAIARRLLKLAAAAGGGGSAWLLIRFATAGAGGLGVSSLSLSILHGLAHLTFPLASGASSELAIVTNYLLIEVWTLPGSLPSWTRFVKFNAAAIAGLGVAALGAWGLVQWLNMQYLLANLVALVASGLLSFGLSVRWIWGRGMR